MRFSTIFLVGFRIYIRLKEMFLLFLAYIGILFILPNIIYIKNNIAAYLLLLQSAMRAAVMVVILTYNKLLNKCTNLIVSQ